LTPGFWAVSISTSREAKENMNQPPATPEYFPGPAEAVAVLEELKRLLGNVYADLDVNRERIRRLVTQARQLVETTNDWPGGTSASQEYLTSLDGLEKKLNQMLDLKKLKDEGLVRAVKL
jgi:hypothetical protein